MTFFFFFFFLLVTTFWAWLFSQLSFLLHISMYIYINHTLSFFYHFFPFFIMGESKIFSKITRLVTCEVQLFIYLEYFYYYYYFYFFNTLRRIGKVLIKGRGTSNSLKCWNYQNGIETNENTRDTISSMKRPCTFNSNMQDGKIEIK